MVESLAPKFSCCDQAYTTGFTGFAECRLHSAKAGLCSANSLPSVTLGKHHSAKPPTAQWSLSSVGFRALGKVPAQGGATWPLCRVLDPGTRQTLKSLPSARPLALGQVAVLLTCEGHFAECFCISTRQSCQFFYFFFLYFSI